MSSIADRVRQYALDGSDADLRRLLTLGAVTEGLTRDAFRRVDVQPGWSAIECGCGPLGSLAILSEFVGPSGRVAGFDFSVPTVERARVVLGELGLPDVKVSVADLNDIDAAEVGGPFDLAYGRYFLMHQQDPVHALRQMATLVRPGGWILAQEPMHLPGPFSHPAAVPALAEYWDLMHEAMELAGAATDGASCLVESAEEAGLVVTTARGSFVVTEAATGFELHRATLAAIRQRVLEANLRSEDEVARLDSELAAATTAGGWVTSGLMNRPGICRG